MRVDVLTCNPCGTLDLIDVALTNPLTDANLPHAARNTPGSASAAASAYEALKINTYGAAVRALPAGSATLVPW